jgi:DNA invertase Pin-like site-specific DNA recombinase
MRVALYARVSTRESARRIKSSGDDRARQDPEIQLQKLRQFAANHQEWQVVEEYIDRASGAKTTRKALDKMLRDARLRKFDLIIITKLDRMMRSLINLQNVLAELRSHGVGLICTDQPIDVRDESPTANLMVNILAAFAEFERELISERVTDGMVGAEDVGRPRKYPHLDRNMIEAALQQRSLKQAATFLKVPVSTLRYHIRLEGGLSALRHEDSVKTPRTPI